MATPPPDPDAERARREAQLRTHFLLGPLEIVPGAAAAVIVPPRETAQPAAAPPINLIRNHGLTDTETSNLTSTVNEPSGATRGQEVLLTANWFASFSTNGGATFTYVNPANTFPSAHGGFCCDQLALYDASHDLMVWFLQYIKDSSGNTIRVAVAHGAAIANQQWSFYDFEPADIGLSGVWFDYPAMAVSNGFLYVTVNTFTISGDNFSVAAVLRLPLADLAAVQGFNYDFFTTGNFSLRPTQGATDTMFFGSHQSTTTLRVFSWPETSTTVTTADVLVQGWNFTGGSGWLGRFDPRITAGWTQANQVGFGWTASPDATFPNTHVRVAVIDTATNSIVTEPHLWSQSLSYAYLATAPGPGAEIAASVSFGGGPIHPSHAVGVYDSTNNWTLRTTVNGTDEPARTVWGDYLSVSRHGSVANRWVATGFTLQGGNDSGDIETRYVEFDIGPTTPQPSVKVTLERPGDRLKKGETMKVSAKVMQSGSPVAGTTVLFSTADASLATVSPSSAQTNSQGIAEATVRGEVRWRSTETDVIAQVAGTTAEDKEPVKVPDLSLLGLAITIALLILVMVWLRRSKAV